jgi:hypothetical protein
MQGELKLNFVEKLAVLDYILISMFTPAGSSR